MEIFYSIVLLLLGVSVFLTGMRMMSSGLKKISGKGVRRLFNKTQNNRFAGLGIGTAMTAIIQSSDATTVMVIGFISAGVMNIFQGISIIMGAYIGTTATGLIVSLSSLDILQYILMLLAFIGIILMFFKQERVKNIGEILTGLGLLFFGIYTLKGALNSEEIHETVGNLFIFIKNPILLFLFGIVFTMITQSCSATTGLLIVLVGNGVLSASSAIYCAIGATIGAVFPAILTSLSATVDCKRTAFIALAIRVISGVLGLAVLWILNGSFGFIDNLAANQNTSLFVAVFMLIYSIITMFMLLPFINPLIKLFTGIIKDKQAEINKKQLKYIDDHLLNQPSIALMQVKKEIINMFEIAQNNFIEAYDCLIKQEFSNEKNITEKEESIDYINNQITNFLIKLTNKVDDQGEKEIGAYFHVLNDIERIGDHAYNFLEESKSMNEKDLSFSDIAKNDLKEVYDIILNMFDLSKEIFSNNDASNLEKLHELEEKTDDHNNKLNSSHYDRLLTNSCRVELSPFYTSLVNALERVADHLTNIGYSVVTPTGDDE